MVVPNLIGSNSTKETQKFPGFPSSFPLLPSFSETLPGYVFLYLPRKCSEFLYCLLWMVKYQSLRMSILKKKLTLSSGKVGFKMYRKRHFKTIQAQFAMTCGHCKQQLRVKDVRVHAPIT